MRKQFTQRVRLIACAVLAVGLAACSAGSGGSGTSTGGSGGSESSDALVIGLGAEPASLDFTKDNGAAIPQALLYNVYETLVKMTPEGELAPALATSWKKSEDGKTYTFQLTPDAKFTNGQAFTADDAVFSIDRVKSDWTIALKSAMDVVQEAKAISPTELEVTLAKPSNDWLFRMTTRLGAMFSKTGVDSLGTKPVGTGPYAMTKFARGDSITLTRNASYWGAKPFFGTVTLKYFKDATALSNALLSGTIDVIGRVDAPESLAQFTGNDKFDVIQGTTNGEVLLSFNNGETVFSDKRVRQAIRHAIDHKALLATCWAGKGNLIGTMVPPTDPWYEDLTGLYPYDQAKAKSLLADAGQEGATLRLRIPTLPYATSCGQVVKSQLEQVGLKVKLETLEFPAAWLTTVFKDADYDMSIIGHVEPRDIGTVFGNPDYYTRYKNPEFTKLLADADAGTPEEQVTYMKEAAKLLSEDAAGDWLFLLPNLMVAEKGITGLPENAITESFDLSALARS